MSYYFIFYYLHSVEACRPFNKLAFFFYFRFTSLQCWKVNKLIVSFVFLFFVGESFCLLIKFVPICSCFVELSSRIMAALNDRAAIRENNSVIPSLVFEETDQYSAFRESAIVMARFSTIS